MMLRNIYNKSSSNSAFTIIELLVVIAVIGILAAIALVSYSGISQKAIIASLTSDLNNNSSQLKLYYIDHGNYPVEFNGDNCPLDILSVVDIRYCLKVSPGTTYQYVPNIAINPPYYCISAIKVSTVYKITNESTPSLGDCSSFGLVGYWPFDGSGAIVTGQTTGLQDLSGVNNNGIASNINGTGMIFVPGKVGSAVWFDGLDDYVGTANSTSLNFTNIFTVVAWIKGDNFLGYDILVKGGNSTSDWEFGVQGNKLELGEAAWGNYWNRHVYSDVLLFNASQWYHVAVIYDNINKTAGFYKDGLSAGVGKQSVDKFGINNPGNIRIGSENANGITGAIDEVRIYNRALSYNEIKAMYDASK